MADFTIDNFTQPLAVNNGADPHSLSLKQFANEILASYFAKVRVSDKIKLKTITHGKSAQFPLTGRATADYFDTKIASSALCSEES